MLASKLEAGRTSVAHQRIAIDLDLGADQIRDTLLHEVLHACRMMLNLELEDDTAEENAIRALSPVLLDVLRSNADFVQFLLTE